MNRRAQDSRSDAASWRFVVPESAKNHSAFARDDLVKTVIAALRGERGAPFRRSRHATTWKVAIASVGGESATIFVKRLDAARGIIARAKAKSRAQRADHVLRISDALRRDGFGVPHVLLAGADRESGSEVIVTSEAAGFMLTRWMNPVHRTALATRRRILYRLGAEIARLHARGYLHGDLTPYNVFASDDDPATITFIDHEGSEKISAASINLARKRMRNLVQLGHFDLPGVSRTDKMRVFRAYASANEFSNRTARQSLLRLVRMIEHRRQRDRAAQRRRPQPAIIAERRAVRG